MIAMRVHRSLTSSTMCVDRITTTSSPMRVEQVVEAAPFGGIEAGGRFVDDDQCRFADQRLRDAEALPHAAGKRVEVLACAHPTDSSAPAAVRPVRCARRDRRCPSESRGDSASRAARCADTRRIPAADNRAGDATHRGSRVRRCRSARCVPASGSCNVASVRISVDLPAPFGPSSPNMPVGNRQRHVLQALRRRWRRSWTGVRSAALKGSPAHRRVRYGNALTAPTAYSCRFNEIAIRGRATIAGRANSWRDRQRTPRRSRAPECFDPLARLRLTMDGSCAAYCAPRAQ